MRYGGTERRRKGGRPRVRTPWNPRGIPFCWLPKLALEKIEQNLDPAQAGSAKLVYLALARVANAERSGTFTKPIEYISVLASVERRTVERRLPDLERLRLVKVERSKKVRTSHVYRLATDAVASLRLGVASLRLKVALNKEVQEHTFSEPHAEGTSSTSETSPPEALGFQEMRKGIALL
jgi:hypothetical protein